MHGAVCIHCINDITTYEIVYPYHTDSMVGHYAHAGIHAYLVGSPFQLVRVTFLVEYSPIIVIAHSVVRCIVGGIKIP